MGLQKPIAALGHEWSTASYVWSSDYSCAATRTCSVCGEIETETATGAVEKGSAASVVNGTLIPAPARGIKCPAARSLGAMY